MTDLFEIWYEDAFCIPNLESVNQNVNRKLIHHGGGGYIGFPFYRNVSAADHPILTKFGMPTEISTPPSKIYPKFDFFKIKDGGRKPS